jgi:hypothetical protein
LVITQMRKKAHFKMNCQTWRSMAGKVSDPRQRDIPAPVFKRIWSNPTHTLYTILSCLSVMTDTRRIFLALKLTRWRRDYVCKWEFDWSAWQELLVSPMKYVLQAFKREP